ncbi:hypothetical protein HMI55_006810 [Coelomomyces lativittatus]|nr:hypothetical protein HMI56_007227 [Coelomomyces lativittatus]KAJ1510879.1 hypothetical protein HMI55_006810 [Coelomomyces lativittatus]
MKQAFARAIGKVWRTEQDTHTIQNGSFNTHPYADTKNLLLNIGEQAIASINAEIPVSPIPYSISPHFDVEARIKVLKRRITIYKAEITGINRQSLAYLQMRQFIGQDLAALESCFKTQKEFNSYTVENFKWNYAMCHLYIGYHQFLVDYPVFLHSGLSWTTIRNECTRWRRWLDSDEAKALPTSDYTSSSFWKGNLPAYRETLTEPDGEGSENYFHSSDSLDNLPNSNESQMAVSISLDNLNLQ